MRDFNFAAIGDISVTSKQSLPDAIRSEFLITPVPSDEALVNSRGLEAEGIKSYLSGKPWPKLTLDSIRNEYDGDGSAIGAFLTEIAYAYYLPSFLIICIETWEEADLIYFNTIMALSPLNEIRLRRLDQISERLNFKQRALIARFLTEMKHEHELYQCNYEADLALSAYWGKYIA